MRALILAALLYPPTPQSEPATVPAVPSVRALPLPSGDTIALDGRLDEAVWNAAPAAAGFKQREPAEGAEASEPTEVRVVYDRQTLYVGVRAFDREPERILSRILQRDRVMEAGGDDRFRFAGDDAVALLFDTFGDRRNAVVFASNPNAAEFDALITDEKEAFNADWRGVWRVAAARDARGWSAEFAIPFRTLRYPDADGDAAWGFNVYRIIRRKNEEALWSAWSREGGGFHRVSAAGRLEGLRDLPRSGLNLEIKPFGLAGADRERDEAGAFASDARVDAGLDLKWELRPGLVFDATLNPDFAQVEADELQVNLTRFDIFLPEKREFFLENAGIFQFGARGLFEPPPFLLFFSRSIGIADDGEIPVHGGVRLTGRAGKQTIGLLDTYTGTAFGEPRRNYGVARLKRDIGESGYLGAIVTDRRSRDAANTTAGLDTSFWLSSTLNVEGFVAGTTTSGPGGDDGAFRIAADYSGDRFGVNAQHLVIGKDAEAEMGFITRNDIRRSGLLARATLRPGWLGLRKVDVFVGGDYIARIDGVKQDHNIGPFVTLDWNSGDRISIFYGKGATRLDESFDLADRVPVPAGDYTLLNWGYFARTSSNRPISFFSDANVFDIYDGRLTEIGGRLRLNTGPRFDVTLGYRRSAADLPAGAFVAHRPSLRLSVSFSTRLSISTYVQYNSLDKELVANLRLNFIHRPGSDLFIAFNEERGDETSAFAFAARRLALKLTYLVRF